jgi:hypothetical protein
MERQSREQETEQMMSRISLWVIGGATVLAFFLGRVIDARPESLQKVLFVGLFLLLAISTSLIVRFIVLPSLARDIHKPRESLYVTAYTEATFPAVLTVVWSIFVSEWWVALVGGVIAVVYWLAVGDYLNRVRLGPT